MLPRTSVGDGFRVSLSSTPSNSSGGSDPDDIESLGDVYIWGEVLADGVSPDGSGIQVPSKTDVLIPRPLESNVVLDVHHIASGARHVAIITRQGEVFTWGEESGGRLGHGIDKDFGHPNLVEFPEVCNFDFVACGEYHTCAVSKSDDLFTWGDGTHNAGLLGHGTEVSHWIPKRMNGPLEGLQVVSVACGTWHSALATSNGKLFTFGDGTFGVLGHGDQESVWYPKEVQLLSGLKTIKVACGVWHTAAIVEVMFQSGSSVSPWKLFTWGDGDKYRLGHGNKETYLQPTRVSPLTEYNFHQIACGHTMTVALTTSGHVFTMGGTEHGQLGNPTSAGKVPTLVQDKLLGEFVDEISCGAHHVAVLTSRSELYTWGRGANGRLGHGDTENRDSPKLVVALKDRHVKNISCGSNFTSCISIHKWVTGTDQSVCTGCRQAFGLTRKRHNCYNCGLVYCHSCSSRKVLKAALAPRPEKPHRVCDTCYAKIKVVEASSASKLNRKATPSHYSTNGSERLGKGVVRSVRTLFSPHTEPVKYLEIRNSKPGSKCDSTSFVRASQVPSPSQLKDIAFPSALSSIQSVLKLAIPPIPSPIEPANSRPSSPHTRRPSPPRSSSPRFSGSLIESLRKKSDLLNQELSKLQNQIQSLEQRSDMQDWEIQKLQRKATEATAMAAVESSNFRVAKEFIESTTDKLKEMTEKLPPEIPQSKILSTIHTRAEDFLKEISEAETSSSPSKEESAQHKASDIPASESGTSDLQEHRLEENVDAAVDDPCQDGGNFLEESNGSKLESEPRNVPDIPASDSGTSELQEHKLLEENVDAAGVDPFQDGGNFLEESNGSKLEYEQQNAPDIPDLDSGTSELQEQRLQENVDAVGVDPNQDGGNSIEESNGLKLESEQQNAPDIPASDSGTSELHEHRLEENADPARVDQPQTGGHVLQKSDGSAVSSTGTAMPPQNVENGSRSLDSSRLGRQGETQVIEQFEPGVYVILMLRPDGIKVFRRVKFGKRRFTETQAQEWWNQNKGRVLRKYSLSHQKLTTGSSNITPHAKEKIETSPS
ncbi:PH, RCC1 and FYVE domains-containing protein 1-like [Gastrolobium bilobum]|uniref:PH, RCC1 and FYVE domains-containing protein 1-like n=1 Tax=Gastrolobium bilobum TaxID=150636 RepID=UPI002AB080F5|nr:PH, RCC1 and FYVE domains-containing protein 1-like [Gastrolobium bilobum]